jgi:hypothetical protein
MRQKLIAAGIRCEVRNCVVDADGTGAVSYPELWIESSSDYHTASILYASPIRLLKQRSEGRF